jgi:hypothetical protein
MAPPVIISMTTIASRNGTLTPTLTSLAAQTVQPDEIRLYLTDGCDRPDMIPRLRCSVVEDRGPVTKLSTVLDHDLPDDTTIVTADDDIIYYERWLESLIEGTERYPGEAVGMAGWDTTALRRGLGFVWATPGRQCDVLEGFAGVAYRKSFFDDGIMSPPSTFKWVDDVWISSFLYHMGIPRRVCRERMCSLSQQPGLHNREDFVMLNRRAAVLGFS